MWLTLALYKINCRSIVSRSGAGREILITNIYNLVSFISNTVGFQPFRNIEYHKAEQGQYGICIRFIHNHFYVSGNLLNSNFLQLL